MMLLFEFFLFFLCSSLEALAFFLFFSTPASLTAAPIWGCNTRTNTYKRSTSIPTPTHIYATALAANTLTCTHINIHVHVYIYTYLYMHVHSRDNVLRGSDIYIHTCTHLNSRPRVHVRVYVHADTFIFTRWVRAGLQDEQRHVPHNSQSWRYSKCLIVFGTISWWVRDSVLAGSLRDKVFWIRDNVLRIRDNVFWIRDNVFKLSLWQNLDEFVERS